MSLNKTPFFELRSGSVDTLLFVVKTPDLDALRTELTRRFEATPEFFAGDVVAIDVRRLAEGERVALADLEKVLRDVRMRPIGIVALPEQTWAIQWANAGGLPVLEARDRRGAPKPSVDEAKPNTEAAAVIEAAVANTPPPPALPAPATIIDRPLRSGQQVYAKGDLIVLGLVSYGAEVIAEGNIHIYAPLRGRALAGVHGNLDARIFCTCLEPELISIAGIYRTTENPLPADVLSKPVQIWLNEEKLMIEPLRLT
ncbi:MULTISPECIES: septum site-determining protein MinC [Caballeronia]|jgi:septum site-determining protein MinC|uniref:Probable septum site-determining protein MinC n=1 Tax=Caballeronia zhejiangensis TaxID=871203 RepID=A0A656QRS7_9BURK|nr:MULTISPECIES: septum site-determining protein MinC [Caballeronia]EKS68431.1 septum formation inhibitor [Burkholderia sp. SJ98]KDR31735.1 septum formation inhibitor [Caballeronia zhejiangensis]MCG7402692.1 septum site-determining protein MinC [Caballeronia zhejiangensis]MCI1044183.1 septum site-determining protein MinC [Caballeronia zhejiangensis]MDR5764484.1 septum site-determining protein MinC [Caballeronia sp. LZ028]